MDDDNGVENMDSSIVFRNRRRSADVLTPVGGIRRYSLRRRVDTDDKVDSVKVKVEIYGRLNEVVEKQKKLEVDLNSLREEHVGQKDLEDHLNMKVKEIDGLKAKVKEGYRLLEEERNKRNALQKNIKKRAKELEDRGKVVTTTTNAEEESAEVTLSSTPASITDTIIESTFSADTNIDGDCTNNKKQDHQQEAATVKSVVEPEIMKETSLSICDKPSESEKRKKMIDDELKIIVKQADENELEEPFDEDSVEALKKGALKICYVKKYYDVMKDKIIYFPSVAQTVVDYRLMEEAEKYYFEEDDEYPQDLSIGLRSVATELVLSQDDDFDEEYMTALAEDIEI